MPSGNSADTLTFIPALLHRTLRRTGSRLLLAMVLLALMVGASYAGDAPTLETATANASGDTFAGPQSGDQVVLTFDRATNAYSISASNIDSTLELSSGHTWGSIQFATWASTYDLLTVVLGVGFPTVSEGDTVSIASGTIMDTTGTIPATGTAQIGGSFGTTGPKTVYVEAMPTAGPMVGIQTGDRVRITFDHATNGYELTSTNVDEVFTLSSGHTWGTIHSATWRTGTAPNSYVDVVLWGTGGATVSVDDTITVASGTIRDIDGTVDADPGPTPSMVGSFGTTPELERALATDAGDHAVDVQTGDEVVLTFDGPTNAYELDGTNMDDVLGLSSGHTWGSPTAVWSTYRWPNARLTITLGTGTPTVAPGDTITLSSGTIRDAGGAVDVRGFPATIVGDFGPIPSIVNAAAGESGDAALGIQAGDEVVISFSNATNGYTITGSNIDSTLVLSSGHSWGGVSAVEWCTREYANDLLRITFDGTGSPTVAAGDTIAIASGTIRDPGGSYDATGSPPAISGHFGAAPMVESAVAESVDTRTGIQSGDRLVLTFDRSTNGYEVTTDNANGVLQVAGEDWGTITSAVWSTVDTANDTLTVTFGDGAHGPSEGDRITFGELTIGDPDGVYDAWGDPVEITGSFGAAPQLVSAAADASGDGLGGPQSGDRVVLTFDKATNAYVVDATNIDTVLALDANYEPHTWGTVQSAVWSSGNQVLTVTLGDGATVALDDYITIPTGMLMDTTSTDDALGSPPAVTGTFGSGPVLTGATAYDSSGAGYGIDEYDTVVLTFDRATNGYEVTASNVGDVLQLGSGHTWGSIVGAEWSTWLYANDELTVTLGSGDPTVQAGDVLTLSTGTIMDTTNTVSAGTTAEIGGGFGDAPELLTATAWPEGGAGSGVQSGETVVLTFDQSTNAYTVTPDNVDTALPLSSGHTWGGVSTAEWSTSWWADDTLTLTLDGTGSPTVAVLDTVAIGTGTIRDDTESIDAAGEVQLGGTFGGAPKLLDAYAEAAGSDVTRIQSGDRVTLTFDNATNAYTITGANVDTALALSSGHTWGDIGSAEWSTGIYANDTLTVTLDTAGTAPTVAVWDTITIGSGTIRDASGTEDAEGSPPEIWGSFGDPTALTSAEAQPYGDSTEGVQASDRVVLTFDQATNGYGIDTANIDTVLAVEDRTWGTQLTATWSTVSHANDTLTVAFGSGGVPTVDVGDVIEIGADTIENALNDDDAQNAWYVSISGTFGGAPRLVTAEAEPAGSPAKGVQSSDRVMLTFDGPTNGYSVDSANIDSTFPLIGYGEPHTWGTITSAVWSTDTFPNDTLTVTLAGTGNPTVAVWDDVEIGHGTVQSPAGHAAESWAWIGGTFGDRPALLCAVMEDTSGGGAGIQGGDTVVLSFDQSTNAYEITPETVDTALALSGGHSWGQIQTAEWTTSWQVLTITLGTDSPSVAVGDSITIGSGTITDFWEGDETAVGSPPPITGSAGAGPAPRLVSAEASDASGLGPGVQAGDAVVLTFDAGTNAYAVTTANADTALSVAGKTWSTLDSAVWSSSDTVLTVTFGTGSPTIQVGDSVAVGDGTIQDAGGTIPAIGSPPEVTGSFGTDDADPTVTLTAPTDELIVTTDSVTVTGSASDDKGVVSLTVDDTAVDPNEAFSEAVDLDVDGAHTITVTATDTAGNTASESRTVYRDTAPPEVLAWNFDKVPFGPGKLGVSVTLTDAIAGIDYAVNPTVTLTPPGSEAITASQTSYTDGVWTGTVVVPASAPGGTCVVRITGAKDTVGNELTAQTGGESEGGDDDGDTGDPGQAEIELLPPPSEPEEGEEAEPGSSAMQLDMLTTSSYVSPAYVQGTLSENVVRVQWKYATESEGSYRDVAVAGDTWWATNIDLDKSGETQDLSLADRTVYVDFRLTDAAGQTTTLPDEMITWKIMTVGEERTETRYKTVDGETVSYEVTVTDHLIQIGEKMIVAADPNICYVDDPPPATQVQITNSQYPVPEVWKDADTSERASPNWVHTFDAEGHWVLKGSFTCWPGDTEDESTIDKTGQTIVGEEKTTTIHVMKPLTIRRVGVWHGDALPDTAEEWDEVQESDGEGSLDGATYALYELPKASTYTEWIRYYIIGGAVADPSGTWAEKTEPDPTLLWWSQRLHLGSNKIEYLAEYNGLLLSHARDDDVTWINQDGIHLFVDTDQDGDLDTDDRDLQNKEMAETVDENDLNEEKSRRNMISYTGDFGALVLVNCDDDRTDEERKGGKWQTDMKDEVITNAEDLKDLSELAIQVDGWKKNDEGYKAWIRLADPLAKKVADHSDVKHKVRIFGKRKESKNFGGYDALVGPKRGRAAQITDLLDEADTPGRLVLKMEGLMFGEEVRISLKVELGNKETKKHRHVRVLTTPFILIPNTQPLIHPGSYETLRAAVYYRADKLAQPFAKDMANVLTKLKISGQSVGRSVFLEDTCEVGYCRRLDASCKTILVILHLEPGHTWDRELVGPEVGYFEAPVRQHPSARGRIVNGDQGGSIGCLPPDARHRYGRVMVVGKYGKVNDSFRTSEPLRAFFRKQRVQAPKGRLVEIPVETLGRYPGGVGGPGRPFEVFLGHADELMTVVPVPGKRNSFKVLIPGVDPALQALRKLNKQTLTQPWPDYEYADQRTKRGKTYSEVIELFSKGGAKGPAREWIRFPKFELKRLNDYTYMSHGFEQVAEVFERLGAQVKAVPMLVDRTHFDVLNRVQGNNLLNAEPMVLPDGSVHIFVPKPQRGAVQIGRDKWVQPAVIHGFQAKYEAALAGLGYNKTNIHWVDASRLKGSAHIGQQHARGGAVHCAVKVFRQPFATDGPKTE